MLRDLEEEAAAQGISKSAVIRNCLESNISKKRKSRRRVTCLDLISDLAGTQPGPSDASTNKEYLIEAIVADFKRGRKNSH